MITLRGEDRTVHTKMLAAAPSEDLSPGKWSIGDDAELGADLAVGVLRVAEGFSGTLTLTLVRPEESERDIAVRVFRRYLDAAGNELSVVASSELTVDEEPAEHTLALSTAPALTASCEYGLITETEPQGVPAVVRTNEYTDPRCYTLATWLGSNSGWTPSLADDDDDIVPGVRHYVKATISASATSSQRGLLMYGNVNDSSPVAGVGFPVTAGQPYTLSAYVRSSRAGTVAASMRYSAGSSWSAATVSGTSVSAAVGDWVRVSVTGTAPAGAVRLWARFLVAPSGTWVVGEHVDVSAVMIEKAGTVGDYFDGGTLAGISGEASVAWEGEALASRSFLYGVVFTPAVVEALESILEYSADAEDLLGAALERPLRRSVADVLNAAPALVTAGTPALLQGQLTYLCRSLAQARGIDAVYQMPGLVVLDSDDELDGLRHRAVGVARITSEQAQNGRAAWWQAQVEFREQVR